MDNGQRMRGQETKDVGQRPLSDVLCPLSSVPGNLLIPFAVHTAKFGYDWSCVPEGLTRDELDACYRLAAERRPQVLEIGTVITGTLVCGRLKFAFSTQIAKGWDANGRNAEYSAFAFLPAFVDLERTDFTEFLAREEFRTPSRQPPKAIPCRLKMPLRTVAPERTVNPAPSRPVTRVSDQSSDHFGRVWTGASAAEPATPSPMPVWADKGEPESPSTNWLSVVLWLSAAIIVLIALISACRS